VNTDVASAERAVRDYLHQFGRFEHVALIFEAHEIGEEGWQFRVRPANPYFRRHRQDLSIALFVDRRDGKVHTIPSYGVKGLVAKLRGDF
jgi:hypothetical protein